MYATARYEGMIHRLQERGSSHHSSTSTTTSTSTHTVYSTLPPPRPTENYTSGLDGTNQVGNYTFINALFLFFALLGIILLLIRIYKLVWNHIRQLFASGARGTQQTQFQVNTTSFWPWVQRHILYAPLWKNRHNKEIQISSAVNIGTLPSRLHFLILAAYFISNIIYCLYLNYNQPRAALLAELRGRSGSLAIFNLIPTILFALRGNPLISALRVSYDTFNLFHRGLARIVIIESVVHVLAWSITCIITSGSGLISQSIKSDLSLQWALVATIVFVVMGLLAWSPFRHAFYETFLNSHRIFAFVGLLGAFEHLKLAGLPQVPYIILAGLFWGADGVCRAFSILWYNRSSSKSTTVMVEALPNEACRLTFDLARAWRYRPGAHVHVYIPKLAQWSSHPFSVAWAEDRHMLTLDDEEKLSSKASASLELDSQAKMQTLVSLLVRARSGMTRKLYNKASASPNNVITLMGAIEGPYGGHESLDSYGTVVLFAGGVGITHQLGYIRHLVEGHDAGTVAARKILLVWSIPEVENLEWVRPWMDQILKIPGRKDVLRIHIHVTKGTVTVTSKTGTVVMAKGRCNVKQTVDEEFLERKGAMAVTVCGPGSFADDVRSATRKRVQLGSLDFIEEAFTY